MKELSGKVAIFTGAGRGIGAACAKGAARRGAKVVVNDIDTTEAHQVVSQIIAEGGEAIACVANIADWDDAGRLVSTCLDEYGRIDGLVNNAALFLLGRLDEFDPATARPLFEVNILGSIHCAAHAVKPMLAQGSGSIINVTSGAHLGIPAMGIYGASKGAVASMTYTWAMELAGSGVRVNALSPFGATRMLDVQGHYNAGDESNAKRLAAIQSPEANSPVVEYLLSDRSIGVSGQIVRIDKRELSLVAHPALLIPPAESETWTLESVAAAFETDLGHRLLPCGVVGVTDRPSALESGFWNRAG